MNDAALTLSVAAATHVGRRRENNQDAVADFQPTGAEERDRMGCVFLVADGMGGAAGGEIASALAVDGVRESYFADPDVDRRAALLRAVQAANRAVYERGQREPLLSGMGTTCTALLLRNGTAEVAHVGDTRAYLVRDGTIVPLTRDHSLASAGQPSVLTRALGASPTVDVDLLENPLAVAAGDIFLLCSDGLWGSITDEELIRVVTQAHEPALLCRDLVALANERGGLDNITVQLVRVSARPARFSRASVPGFLAGLRRLLRVS